MIKTTYQTPELRDANDNVVQEGAFGKNSPLTNATNDGAFDYILNNLEALHDTIGDSAPTLDGNGHVVEPANLAIGDEDGLRIKNNYLKLSGGNVTGVTSFRTDLRMLDNQDNRFGGLYVPSTTATEQYMQLYGGTRATGDARLTLYPSGDGHFQLLAYSNDGSNSYALQSDNAGNLNWRGYPLAWKKDYLPLAGGTMTGFLYFANADNRIRVNYNNNAGQLNLYGGIDMSHGAYLGLNGSNFGNAGGRFILIANDGTNSAQLVGRPDGTFTWGGKNIEVVESKGTNYIRYVSGLQVCWGSGVTTAPATAVTYPVAFSAVPATILTAKGVATSTQVGVIKAADRTNTAFTPVMVNNNTITAGNYDYIAIGYWK